MITSQLQDTYITIRRSVKILITSHDSTQKYFVWKNDIKTFRIWIRNYFIYNRWVLMFIWKFMIFYGIQAFWLKISFHMIVKNKPNFEFMKFQIEIFFALGVLRIRPTRHSKAQNANFVLRKYWMLSSHYSCEYWFLGTIRKLCIFSGQT